MKTFLLTLTLVFGLLILSKGQTKVDQSSTEPVWTEADRKYLLDNLIRSKEEIVRETKNLTPYSLKRRNCQGNKKSNERTMEF